MGYQIKRRCRVRFSLIRYQSLRFRFLGGGDFLEECVCADSPKIITELKKTSMSELFPFSPMPDKIVADPKRLRPPMVTWRKRAQTGHILPTLHTDNKVTDWLMTFIENLMTWRI